MSRQLPSNMPSLTSHEGGDNATSSTTTTTTVDCAGKPTTVTTTISEVTRRKQIYGDVINEMSSRTVIVKHDPFVDTIVPTDSKRVVLIASKSRGSDWDLSNNSVNNNTTASTTGSPGPKGEHDTSNGLESEDSGFQVDADPAVVKPDTTGSADMTILSSSKTGTTVINVTPVSAKPEHRMLEHLHSTPLPAVVSAQVTTVAQQPAINEIPTRRSSVKEIAEQIKSVIAPVLLNPRNRELNKGPDQMAPADSFVTTSPTGAVKLKLDDERAAIAPISVPTVLQQTTARYMDQPALAVKRDGKWIKWTYKQYLHDVTVCAKAFIRLGLERFHSVCILGFNSPEWLIADLAAIHAGGFAAGIYTTNSPEACLHCAINGQCDIMVVEDRKQLEKILQIRDKIPTLKAIVQYTGKPHTEGVISWSQLMNYGNSTPDNVLEERLRKVAVNQCCTIIYTSGTTGPPKGVMLDHDNLTWLSHVLATYMNVRFGKDTFLSYLPLSHIAAQITDIYVPLTTGGTVYFAQPDALKGSLIDTLREVRPTTFFGVPRVWEKIYEKMQEVGKSTRGVKRAIATWSKNVGLTYYRRRMEGRNSKPFGFALANALVFKKVRAGLGLDRCHLIFSGAAPLSKEVAEYFLSLDIPILECYGMSESTGPHSVNNVFKGFHVNSGGKAAVGAITKIANPDKDGNGEILMGGRHIFMGYLNDPVNTAEALDADGFLHSGDIGFVDKRGMIFITGRLKEILITAGGENVAPILIEDNIKAELPFISHAMVVGDRRKFLSVLLTAKTEVDKETTEPLPILTNATREWCKEAGLSLAETVTDIISAAERGRPTEGGAAPGISVQDTEAVRFVQAIENGIQRANAKAISGAQRVQKWAFLPVDFSIPGGELGPTMKIKRGVVTKKYADLIERFYV